MNDKYVYSIVTAYLLCDQYIMHADCLAESQGPGSSEHSVHVSSPVSPYPPPTLTERGFQGSVYLLSPGSVTVLGITVTDIDTVVTR